MEERIKILFLAAEPVDTTRLRLSKERKEINKKIRAALHRDSFELVSEEALTAEDLREALLRHHPHIVHFSGHGSKSGCLVVEDESGKARMLDRKALTALFQVLKDDIRIVVLNACYSKLQAGAMKQVVDYTIGMSTTISDKAAILFSAAFYSALGFGRTVKEAFELARIALLMDFPQEHKTPLLLARERADSVSGYLIKQPTSPAQAKIFALRDRWGKEPDPWKRYWLAISVGDIGGRKAFEALQSMRSQEGDEFAQLGVDEALRAVGEPIR
jgi:CHAT domain